MHFEWSMRALHAGKHVLVEKPMTSTADEARQIFALAARKGLVALEAIHCTFVPSSPCAPSGDATRDRPQSGRGER